MICLFFCAKEMKLPNVKPQGSELGELREVFAGNVTATCSLSSSSISVLLSAGDRHLIQTTQTNSLYQAAKPLHVGSGVVLYFG